MNLRPPVARARSARAHQVARWFGLEARRAARPHDACATVATFLPAPGAVTLVTGASGSGKSSLLRAARRASTARWIDVDELRPRAAALVDCFDGCALRETLALLARVGLAEARTYLQTPADLSDGQRWRLKLALALHEASREARGRTILCADEFCAVLDRVTAMIVARTLRRAIAAPLGAIVSTSHDDLAEALQPDLIVTCDFERVFLSRPAGPGAAQGAPSSPAERVDVIKR
jgi:ABC-type ATPase with predicted acetyltransferase domain